MLCLRLKPEIEERLERLSKLTGRTKTFYATEAILEHIEDLEDAYLATKSLKKGGRIFSSDEIERELGL